MNWKRYFGSVLVAWAVVVGIAVFRALFTGLRADFPIASVPVVLIIHLLTLGLVSCVFYLPQFLLVRRFLSDPTRFVPYATVGAVSGPFIMILLRALSGVARPTTQYLIESITGALIGVIFAHGFARAQESEHSKGV